MHGRTVGGGYILFTFNSRTSLCLRTVEYCLHWIETRSLKATLNLCDVLSNLSLDISLPFSGPPFTGWLKPGGKRSYATEKGINKSCIRKINQTHVLSISFLRPCSWVFHVQFFTLVHIELIMLFSITTFPL